MDWPRIILLTYGFLLALLLVAVIMKSLNSSRNRYQKLLEEKEQKLSAIQLDLEATMDTLGDQAAALELTLQEADRRENAANQALQQRLLEVQGAVVSAQSRLLRLEQSIEEMRKAAALPQGGIEIAPEEPGNVPELPQAEDGEAQDAAREEAGGEAAEPKRETAPETEPDVQLEKAPAKEKRPRGHKKAEKPEDKSEPLTETAEEHNLEPAANEDESIRNMLVTLFEHGGTVAEAARAAGCSSVEASMIYNQWKRGYISQNIPGK